MSRLPLALLARAVALIVVGAALIVLALIAPPPQTDPAPARWRPATEADERERERQMLRDEMDAYRARLDAEDCQRLTRHATLPE